MDVEASSTRERVAAACWVQPRGRGCGVGGWWGDCVDGRRWRIADLAAIRGVTGGLRGRALEALAGEGGVGRERAPDAPVSVIFGK